MDRTLLSSWVKNKNFTTKYEIGKFVSSPTPQCPLSVFNTHADALAFQEAMRSWSIYTKIFSCHIKNKTKIPWLPGTSDKARYFDYNILKKIKNKKKFLHLVKTNLPTGTTTCKQVKLLEELTSS